MADGDPWVGWTGVAGTNDIQSGQGRQLTAATAYAPAIANKDDPLPQNFNLRVDTTITTVTAAEFYGAVNVRTQMPMMYTAAGIMPNSSWHLRFVGTATLGIGELYRVSSTGVQTLLQSGSNNQFVQGSFLHIRLQVEGATFRARYWKNAEAEPSTWQIDYTDATPPTGGGLSFGIRAGNNASADDWRWDDVLITNNATGTLAQTLANTTSAAAGSSVTGTVASTLSNVTSDATAATAVHFALTPDSVLTYATDPEVDDGEIAYEFISGAIVPLLQGTFSLVISGSLAETLDTVATQSPVLDENGSPVLDENGQQLLSDMAFGASGAAGTLARALANVTAAAAGSHTAIAVTGTVAKTLADITSQTSSYTTVIGTFARALANVTAAASGGSSNGGVLARTLAPVVSTATGAHGVTGNVAVALGNVTAAAVGAADIVTGTLAETLDGVETGAALTDDLGAVITDDLGNIVYAPGAEGLHGVGATLAVTLANITSAAAGTATSVVGTVAVTLDDVVTTGASGSPGAAGTLDVTLADATSAADGTVGVTGEALVTLGAVTSAADGTHDPIIIAGNLAVTLDALVAAAGGSSTAGEIVRTLDNATSTAAGTAGAAPITGTVAVTLDNINSTSAGTTTSIGSLARTLGDIVGDAVGSSVTGTVAVQLGDITIAASAAASITVYGTGHVEAIYQTGRTEAIFEAGRVAAVAGSRV